ncbi:hypothetical protein [Sedimenticola hydrogenitrophicus]|uniref:hypothetical protein n=1 Tax=Sedimenticola hydrogenitrophicus TaxID=2967975 RepID=UPI0023AE9F3E|nr:hypothetical protein [Sedimenticola hydrogenitrophicus]
MNLDDLKRLSKHVSEKSENLGKQAQEAVTRVRKRGVKETLNDAVEAVTDSASELTNNAENRHPI